MNSSSPEPLRPGRYPVTEWSQVRAAGKGDKTALNNLFNSYWFPVYAAFYDRTKNHHDAEDLTQRLLSEIYRRSDLNEIAEENGHFRSFLKATVSHLHSNFVKERTALKRGGGKTILSIDIEAAEQLIQSEETTHLDPSATFDRRWFLAVIDRAARQLKDALVQEKKLAYFDAFEDFLLPDSGPIPYAEIAVRLKIKPSNARVIVFRLRSRFKNLLHNCILETVGQHSQADEELAYLSDLIGVDFMNSTNEQSD